ncbi:hypothetical protein PQ43W_65 [Ralstonia phage PQ43W]
MTPLEPVKASLVADLVSLINENLGELLRVRTVSCSDCCGTGQTGSDYEGDSSTCATCGGVGAVERYEIDHQRLKTPRFGRLVEGFDVKHGQVVPKLRSKDKAFAMLVKLLGFDKAVVEIASGVTFADTISEDARAQYVDQLKELAALGLLDRVA